eukprot:3302517-Pyramimonas_sp.AAC.1
MAYPRTRCRRRQAWLRLLEPLNTSSATAPPARAAKVGSARRGRRQSSWRRRWRARGKAPAARPAGRRPGRPC